MKKMKPMDIAIHCIFIGILPLLFDGCEKDLKAVYAQEKKHFEMREDARIASEKAFTDKLRSYSYFKEKTPEAIAEEKRKQIEAEIWCEACDRKRALVEKREAEDPDFKYWELPDDLVKQLEAKIRKERGLAEDCRPLLGHKHAVPGL